MDLLRSSAFGVSTNHQKDFTVIRPRGCNDYLLMRFYTRTENNTRHGRQICHEGDMILHTPGFPQWCRGYKCGFINDWIHISGNDIEKILLKYNIPLNEYFSPLNTDFIVPILLEIRKETARKEKFSTEQISGKIHELLRLTGRNYNHNKNKMTGEFDNTYHYLLFCNIREKLYNNSYKNWTIKELAEMANLSENRFAVLYKQFFHISPIKDLLEIRISKARILLTNTTDQISLIAMDTGFNEISYFSRTFKKQTGFSPRKFRQMG
ncbi:MAG: helix-turn-helix transcriptional regulator [Spirochaetaceae bacterium]